MLNLTLFDENVLDTKCAMDTMIIKKDLAILTGILPISISMGNDSLSNYIAFHFTQDTSIMISPKR